jgi:hypothetical protein
MVSSKIVVSKINNTSLFSFATVIDGNIANSAGVQVNNPNDIDYPIGLGPNDQINELTESGRTFGMFNRFRPINGFRPLAPFRPFRRQTVVTTTVSPTSAQQATNNNQRPFRRVLVELMRPLYPFRPSNIMSHLRPGTPVEHHR